jgi:uncharacterized protein involved in exopolysaccharide biosynthesis
MSENEILYRKITWTDIVNALKKRKKLILGIFLSGTFLSLILAFVLPKQYESKAVILPVSSSTSLGGVSDLAALAGFSIGNTDEINKIMVVLNSRSIKERVIKRLNLIPVLVKEDEAEDRDPLTLAVKKLKKKITISLNKRYSSISISVFFKDPALAQKIAQTYIEEARKILNEKKLSVAKFDRIYLEKKLKEEEKKLKNIQKRLAEFQKKTKLVDPNSQLKSLLDMYLSLLSKRTELLLEINSLSMSLSPNSPKIKNLKNQISFIDQQLKKFENNSKFFPALKKIPEILSEYSDIMRELKTSQAIYETLMKLYQQARLNESKERFFIEVIDPPSLPDIPSKPKKKLIIIGGSFFSLVIGAVLAFFLECCFSRREKE